jgi:hypothetical protein
MTATTEFVVPRSMPMILLICLPSHGKSMRAPPGTPESSSYNFAIIKY